MRREWRTAVDWCARLRRFHGARSQAAIILGFVLGFASFYGARILKHKLHIDDALEVSMVHGLTGVIGALAIGVAADRSYNPELENQGLIHGDSKLMGLQVMAVAFTVAYTVVVTLIILFVLKRMFGSLRCTALEEQHGLDGVDHGDVAYHFLTKREEREALQPENEPLLSPLNGT